METKIKEQIDKRLGELNIELAALQTFHDRMVADFQSRQTQFQTRVQSNQLRFQQITGAIEELTKLLTHEQPTTECNGERGLAFQHPDGVPDDRYSPGDYLGAPVVHRNLDKPDTAPD
jgi:hypothetical protein